MADRDREARKERINTYMRQVGCTYEQAARVVDAPGRAEHGGTGSESRRAWLCDKCDELMSRADGSTEAHCAGSLTRGTAHNPAPMRAVELGEVESRQPDERDEAEAEFVRVVGFLDEQGVTLRQGFDGDPIYHGGHTLEGLADAYADRGAPKEGDNGE